MAEASRPQTAKPSLRARLRTHIERNYGTPRGFVRAMLAQTELVLGWLDKHLHPDTRNTRRLVFVCLGNINRSAFAEAVARKAGAHTCSIGLSTTTGAPAFQTAITTAQEFAIDLRGHRATNITDYHYESGDLLLVMETRHALALRDHGIPTEAIALLGYWASPRRIHLHDPHTLSDAWFRSCFTLIHSAVGGLLGELRAVQTLAVIREPRSN